MTLGFVCSFSDCFRWQLGYLLRDFSCFLRKTCASMHFILRTAFAAFHRFCKGVFSFGGCPGGSVVKNPHANAEDTSLIPELGRSSGEGNSNPLQCSCLENPMDGGTWQTVVHEASKSQTQFSDWAYTFSLSFVSRYFSFSFISSL